MRDESKKWAGIAVKAKEKATKHQNLIKELKADIVEKDTCLDHIQKKNDELSTLLSKAKKMPLQSSRRLKNLWTYWIATT